MRRIFISLVITGAFSSCFFSCTKDRGRLELSCKNLRATYKKDIEPIIFSNCMGSNCHNTTTYIGDYSTYQGVKAKVDDGTFKLRVIDLKVMPPVTRTPLSEEDIAKISCWLADGAPNN